MVASVRATSEHAGISHRPGGGRRRVLDVCAWGPKVRDGPMPIYVYGCNECGAVEEHLQRISDPPLTECPHCGGRLEKQVTSAAFQLKGGGWYKDLYSSSKPDKGGGGSDSSGGGGSGSSSDSGSSGGGSSGGSSDSAKPKGGGSSPPTSSTPSTAAE